MRTISTLAILAAGLLWSPAMAFAQHDLHALHKQAHQEAAPVSQGETVSLQGDQSAWIKSPEIHSFYDLSVASLGKGAPKLDFEAYRDKSYAIYRTFAASMGVNPDAMVEHLKDIPRQMVGIVKDDPKVLDSYEAFTVALMGPQ
ncbi:MAG: hypothetical protein ABMA14_05615 [Hyphomonadaceae bacterium]